MDYSEQRGVNFQCFVVAPGVWDNDRLPPPPGCDGFGPPPPPPVYLNVMLYDSFDNLEKIISPLLFENHTYTT